MKWILQDENVGFGQEYLSGRAPCGIKFSISKFLFKGEILRDDSISPLGHENLKGLEWAHLVRFLELMGAKT
jgi:hypothetical protein